MASQLPDSLSVKILNMNMEDLKSVLSQKCINIKGLTKNQLQSQLIKLNLNVETEDRDERGSVCSQNSIHTNIPVESEVVALNRLDLEMRRLELATEAQFKEKELAVQTQLKELEIQTQLKENELTAQVMKKELETQTQLKQREI